MSLHRDELESFSRAFAARRQTISPDRCPAPEQLYEAASGDLDQQQRLHVIDHVTQCAECSEAWRLAMELGVRPEGIEQPTSSQPAQVSRDEPPERTRTWKLGIAASLVLSFGLAAYVTLRDASPGYRSGNDSTAPVSQVAERLPRDRFLLKWSDGPSGSTYAVRLSTENLALLFTQQDLVRPELLVPAAALERTQPGERLLWQVEARLPDGRRISSETFIVTLE